MFKHIPVMLKEVIEQLNCEEGKTIVDATLGVGGHSRAILEKGCRLVAIDRDEDALNAAKENLK